MEAIKFVIDIFFILYPLILYIILKRYVMEPLMYGVHIGDYSIYDIDVIKISALYLIYPVMLYYIFNLRIIYVMVQIYYTIIVLSISAIGYIRKKYHTEYFLMGFLFSAFLSEYWEIPFYLSMGIHYNVGVPMHTEILGKITKLAMGILGLDLMSKLEHNHRRTIFCLVVGMFVSTLITFYIDGSYGGNSYIAWMYRLASFLLLYLNIVFK